MFDYPKRAFVVGVLSCFMLLLIMIGTGLSAIPTATHHYTDTITGATWEDDESGDHIIHAGTNNFSKISADTPNNIDYALLNNCTNGSVCYGVMPNDIVTSNNHNFSICSWVKEEDNLGSSINNFLWDITGSGGQAWLVWIYKDPSLGFYDGAWTTDNSKNPTVWQHYCLTYNGAKSKVYADGSLLMEHTNSIPQTTVANLGQWTGHNAGYQGKILYADMRIWNNNNLTNAQVLEVYQANSSTPPASNDTFQINITHPTASQEIFNYTHYLEFKAFDGSASYDINISIDGTFNQTVNVTNNTLTIVWFNLTAGSHYFNLTRESNASEKNSVTFTAEHSKGRFIYDIRINRNVCIGLPDCCFGTQKWLLREEYAVGCTGNGISPPYTFGNASETSSIKHTINAPFPAIDPYYVVTSGIWLEVAYVPEVTGIYNPIFEFNGTNHSFVKTTEIKEIGTAYDSYTPLSANHMDVPTGTKFVYYLSPNITMPFIQTNNTNISVVGHWKLNVTNDPHSTEENISDYFAVVGKDMTKNKNELFEGGTMSSIGYFKNLSANGMTLSSKLYVGDVYNGTATAIRQEIDNYTTTISHIFSTLSSLNTSYNITQQLNISYNGQQRLENFSVPDITIYRINITRCESSGAFVINVKDEADNSFLTNETFYLQVGAWVNTLYPRNFSFNYSSNTTSSNISLCVKPSNMSLIVDVDAIVIKVYYDNGELAVNDKTINATTPSKYILYLINSTKGTAIVVEALGNNDEALVNHIVYIQKFYYDQNSYISIYSSRTDDEGRVVPKLDWFDTYYVFIVAYPNGSVAKQFEPTILTESPLKLRVLGTSEGFANVYYNIQHNCTYNNATKILRCTVIDPSQSVVSANLKVYENVLFAYSEICNTQSTGSAITLTCDLSSASATSFTYTLSGDISGFSPHIFEKGEIFEPDAIAYGNSGLLAGLVLVLVGTMVGLTIAGGIGAILIGILTFMLSVYLNLFPMQNNATGLTSVIIIGLIVIILSRRSS